MVHRRGRPWQSPTTRQVWSKVESFEDLADRHALIDQPAVHRAHQVSFGLVDHEMARCTLLLRHVAIAVRCSAAQVLTGARFLQLAATEALAEQCSFVLGDGALDLEQEWFCDIGLG